MKIKSKNTRLWIARIIVFVLLPIIIFLTLYFTDNLNIFYNKVQEKITNASIISIVVTILLFFWDIMKSRVSDYVSEQLFPSETKQIKKDTSEIKERQISHGKTLKEILENVNFNPAIIRNYLQKLSSINSLEEKIKQI